MRYDKVNTSSSALAVSSIVAKSLLTNSRSPELTTLYSEEQLYLSSLLTPLSFPRIPLEREPPMLLSNECPRAVALESLKRRRLTIMVVVAALNDAMPPSRFFLGSFLRIAECTLS